MRHTLELIDPGPSLLNEVHGCNLKTWGLLLQNCMASISTIYVMQNIINGEDGDDCAL